MLDLPGLKGRFLEVCKLIVAHGADVNLILADAQVRWPS